MMQFIYVFDDEGRDRLLSLQYEMLKYDAQTHISIFLNKEQQYFADGDFKYALSDVLTF